MPKTPQQFYDDLADNYSLIFPDWHSSIKWQSRVIGKLIGRPPLSVLDCSCGIGTQAIGLAKLGYKVHATDISSKEIEKAKEAAHDMDADLTFGVADFRTLDSQVVGKYDVVISFDNSLPHLLTDEHITKALNAMKTKLAEGGKLFISIRDYDSLLIEKPTATTPQVDRTKNGEKIYFQTWQWDNESPTYQTSFFILVSQERSWKVITSSTTYRALRKNELTTLLSASGYRDIEWIKPQHSGYHQPIVSATNRTL